jgi:hypothetical protein
MAFFSTSFAARRVPTSLVPESPRRQRARFHLIEAGLQICVIKSNEDFALADCLAGLHANIDDAREEFGGDRRFMHRPNSSYGRLGSRLPHHLHLTDILLRDRG